MKELDSFTEARLEDFIRQPLENGLTRSEQMELVRFALAAKRVCPTINVRFKDGWPVESSIGVVKDFPKLIDGYHDFYTIPPENKMTFKTLEWDEHRGIYTTVIYFDGGFEYLHACNTATGWSLYADNTDPSELISTFHDTLEEAQKEGQRLHEESIKRIYFQGEN